MGKKRIKLIDNTPEVKKTSKVRSGKAEESRLTDMGQKALEDLEKIRTKEKQLEQEIAKKAGAEARKEAELKTGSQKPKAKKVRSRRYLALRRKIDKTKLYPLKEAVDLVIKNAGAEFDESVEVHLRLKDKLSGSVGLPYGTGKQQRVAVADETLIEEISQGKINFDILVASPALMPKLAKVAKILGPKGLMPNPKTGTISDRPEALKKKLETGQVYFKTESKNPLLHFSFGKTSFGPEKLAANLEALLEAVKKTDIIKATLCSTMGPGVKLDLSSLVK